MLVKQLDHVNISAENLTETLDWYHRVFGFEKVEEGTNQDGTDWAIIKCGDALIALRERKGFKMLNWEENADAGRHYVGHFSLRITDQADWERSIAQNNLELLYGGIVEWPYSTSWYVKDPTGHHIEVVNWHNETIKF